MGAVASMRKLSLRYRVAAGVLLGLMALFAVFGYLAVRTIRQSRDVALGERLRLAESTARSIDALVRHTVRQLEFTERLFILDPDDPEREQVQWLYDTIGTFDTIVRLDPEGRVLWTVPPLPASHEWAFAGDPNVIQGTQRTTTSVVGVSTPRGEQPLLGIVMVPVHDSQNQPTGFLAGELRLSHRGVDLIPLIGKGDTGHAEVVDSRGYVVALPEGIEGIDRDEHVDSVAPFLASSQPGTTIHHLGDGKDHVVAYYPLVALPGGVIVEQRMDEALAVPRDLQRRMTYFGLGALVVASLAAWLHANGVVQPIRKLTAASTRIAEGALDDPVAATTREDEVGELARSFETMRQKLKDSLEERRRWEDQLEQRVRQRTQQVEWLLGKVISAQEEERKRIARELHDESAQALAALLVGIQTADDTLPPEATEAKASLARVKPQAARALEDMRKMILDLRPTALDDLGLASAIRWYAETRLETAGVRVSWRISGQERRLPGPVETALFRMTQEAINNIAKHARARNVTLHLQSGERQVAIVVEDDGRGFDVAAAADSTNETQGLGLPGMKERAMLIGGNVTIESEPGQGTRVRIDVPL